MIEFKVEDIPMILKFQKEAEDGLLEYCASCSVNRSDGHPVCKDEYWCKKFAEMHDEDIYQAVLVLLEKLYSKI